MDALTARWLMLKELSDEKLEELHRLERAVLEFCREEAARGVSAFTLPVWWQSGLSWLGRETGPFWDDAVPAAERQRRIEAFKSGAEAALAKTGLARASFYDDAAALHAADRAVKSRAPAAPRGDLRVERVLMAMR